MFSRIPLCDQRVCVIAGLKPKKQRLSFVLKLTVKSWNNLLQNLQRSKRIWNTYKYAMLRRILHFWKWLDNSIQEYFASSIILFFLASCHLIVRKPRQGYTLWLLSCCSFLINSWASRPKALFWGNGCQLGNSEELLLLNAENLDPFLHSQSHPSS